ARHQHHAVDRRDAGADHHADHHDPDPDARREAEHARRYASAAAHAAGGHHDRSRLRRYSHLERPGAREPQGARAEAARCGCAADPARGASAPEQACEVRARRARDGLRATAGHHQARLDRSGAIHPLSAAAMRPLRILLTLLLAAWVAGAAAQGATLRPEVGKPVQAALDALKQKRGKEALAKAREAQAIPNKTAYESYMVERVIGQAAVAAGDTGTAARSLEAAANSPAAPEGERRQIIAAAATLYYSLKEYGKSAELASRYIRDGGTDKS